MDIDNRFRYQLLGRLQMDCDYFLGHGNRSTRQLFYDTVEEHLEEMEKLRNELNPEWLTDLEMENYKKEMLKDLV